LQVAARVADHGQNPQAASDAPRWRVMDDNVTIAVEWNFPQEAIDGLIARGHVVKVAERFNTEFGCAQMAMKVEHGYIAASDHRKDGYPVGM
jgi:gamma-glutamyltranspeptidase/glutathione hydrolase